MVSNSTKTKRIFLAHPKGLSDDELSVLAVRARSALEALAASAGKTTAIVVVLGKDDFDARWSQLGSWEAWAREVVDGKLRFGDDEPRYHAIVLTHAHLGNATRLIVQHALAARRPVLLLKDDNSLVVISAVVERDREDWKTGWAAR